MRPRCSFCDKDKLTDKQVRVIEQKRRCGDEHSKIACEDCWPKVRKDNHRTPATSKRYVQGG